MDCGCNRRGFGNLLPCQGRQQPAERPSAGVVDDIVGSVNGIVADVSKTWTEFVSSQNESLRRDIVTDDDTTAGKVAALGKVTDTAWYHVDMDKIRGTLMSAAGKGESRHASQLSAETRQNPD